MNTCIKRVREWLDQRPKAKQWVWFLALWLAGLLTVMAMAYPIKFLIQSLK